MEGTMNAKRRRTVLGVGALVALLYALWRLLETRQRETGVSWEPQPFPMPPRPVPTPGSREPAPQPAVADPAAAEPAPPQAAPGPWVDAVEGSCPVSHPVKGKLASGIFHSPGGQMYERTRADRCYADPGAAEADGLRASKR
jgi:hypothetical protein